MYVYEMKFSILKPFVKLKDEKDRLEIAFKEAQEEYNKIYIYKNNSGRLIRFVSIDDDVERISICLESTDKLNYPSKAISKFTRILVKSGNIDHLIYNKRLFVCNDVSEKIEEPVLSDKPRWENTKVVISDAQLVGILAVWLIDVSPADASLIQKKKIECINDFKIKMQGILIDDNLTEYFGLNNIKNIKK